GAWPHHAPRIRTLFKLEYNATLYKCERVSLEQTMRKSRAETAETRKRIIATSANVFLRQGIAATGVADLMVAAGLTAGGFYRHFESKEQLVAEANALAFQELFAMFDTAVAGKA